MFSTRIRMTVVALMLATVAGAARRPGEPLRPGWNLFSKQDDVQIGQQNAKQVLEQYEVVKDKFIQDYVQRLGQKLASEPEAKASGFNFTFTVLNVDQINAFALPGGPMFIYTGLLKAVDNEAQLVGVMGHEMSHVILRHGTHEATKANFVQLLAGGLGALIGGDSAAGRLAETGLGMAGNSFILKFSRDAESEADALGAHLMAEAGYDPVQMAKFFEKLGSSGPQQIQFLSDHPNPGNREAAIIAEMKTMPAHQYTASTGLFARMKSELAKVPPPAKKTPAAQSSAAPAPASNAPASTVPPPAAAPAPAGWQVYQGAGFSINYPQGWQVFGQQNASDVTLAPKDGVVTRNNATQIGFGAVISQYAPKNSRAALLDATNELIVGLENDNPQMAITSSPRALSLPGGPAAMTSTLRSGSVFGGNEVDTLVTVQRSGQLWYIVFVAPEQDQPRVADTFKQMLNSLRLQ